MASYRGNVDVVNRLLVESGDARIPLPTASSTAGMQQVYVDQDGKLWKVGN